MKKSTIIAIGVAASISAWGVGIYGSFISKESSIKESLTEVDEQFQVRNALIPDIISTAKIYAPEETLLFEQIDSTLKAISEQELNTEEITPKQIEQYIHNQYEFSNAIDKLIALQESCTQLRENQTFQEQQSSLQESNQLIAEKMEYLEFAIENYNKSLGRIPNRFIASWFNFAPINIKCDQECE